MSGQHGVCRGCGGMVVDAFCIACKKPPKIYNDIATSIDLRDQFAMAALTGVLSSSDITKFIASKSNLGGTSAEAGEFMAQTVFEIADAMMKERDK